uniref:Organic cation transporter-like protein n=2 Tax=Cacopsylla melanoneura TaxID=428564 RepID=A0A8D8ZQ27_9HEMI
MFVIPFVFPQNSIYFMAYDDILLKLGEFGRYQQRIYFLLCLPAMSCALHKLIGVFLNLFFRFVCNLIYYGLSWNTSNLGGNMYINFVISGLVEIPAYTLNMLCLDKFGRKMFLCPYLILSGLCLTMTIFVPVEYTSVSIVLAMFGKFFITGAYGAVYVFSAEQFPTVIRNIGIGAGSTIARLGGILASYTSVLADIWKPFPFVLFGVLSLIAGILCLLLPETRGRKLPESIADGENFGRKKSKL